MKSEAELERVRARLEQRLEELERELELFKLLLELIDGELHGSGSAPPRATAPTAPKSGRAGEQVVEERELGRKLSEETLKSRDNKDLAVFTVYERGLVIMPLIEVPGNSPPFHNFFIVKVLNGYRKQDERAARYRDISEDEKLDFKVFEEEGLVRKVVIWNWRERRRLDEIRSAARWAFSRARARGGLSESSSWLGRWLPAVRRV